jgi:hypothetical protein
MFHNGKVSGRCAGSDSTCEPRPEEAKSAFVEKLLADKIAVSRKEFLYLPADVNLFEC